MGYLVSDPEPRGEVLIAGNNVSSGYYKMEDKTAEDFRRHQDGKIWFHTGDVAVMERDGALRIIDRKKDLIKLAGGEFVALGKVEAALKQVPGIACVCVFAKPDMDHCVAIVSQPEKGWGSAGGRPEEVVLLAEATKKLKEGGMSRFEIPTKLRVDDTIWTPVSEEMREGGGEAGEGAGACYVTCEQESGLVTASLKLQRNPLRTFYNQPGSGERGERGGCTHSDEGGLLEQMGCTNIDNTVRPLGAVNLCCVDECFISLPCVACNIHELSCARKLHQSISLPYQVTWSSQVQHPLVISKSARSFSPSASSSAMHSHLRQQTLRLRIQEFQNDFDAWDLLALVNPLINSISKTFTLIKLAKIARPAGECNKTRNNIFAFMV
eukprot:760527-Hanusia_phi.AAC.4